MCPKLSCMTTGTIIWYIIIGYFPPKFVIFLKRAKSQALQADFIFVIGEIGQLNEKSVHNPS